MKIAVIGAGGVGGYFGGRLAQAGEDVVFIVRSATLDALRSRGLQVDSIKGDFHLPSVHATDDPSSVGPVDAILVTVKTWQIRDAIVQAKPMLGLDTAVVPLENGMDAPDEIAEAVGREHALGGLCAIVSFLAAPGHVRHVAAEPMIMFGELDNAKSERCDRLREAFVRAGVAAEIPPDIHRSMWTKFLFIAPMSGVGAVTRVPIGVWRSMAETRAMAEAAAGEIIRVASARGVQLDPDALRLTMKRYDNLAADATSSLQRDVMEGRPSELEAQLGAVVRMGRETCVSTPVSEFLYHALLPQERVARAR